MAETFAYVIVIGMTWLPPPKNAIATLNLLLLI